MSINKVIISGNLTRDAEQSTLSWQLREHGTAVHNGRSYEFEGEL